MHQVLFRIPIYWFGDEGIPIYGYGAMLFVAFVFCTWWACRLAVREGIAPQRIQDLAIWLFVGAIAGARITFMIQYDVPIWQFFKIWEGGLVVYGAVPGGLIAYFLAYRFMLRKDGISSWKMADIIAPCFALGLALGRVGCLLNGCCYGNVACPDCPSISFPLSAPARHHMVKEGYQTAAGFTLDPKKEATVGLVEPGSPAAKAGLKEQDKILKINGQAVERDDDLRDALDAKGLPRGKNDLVLTVQHAGDPNEITLPAFTPWTIGLNPTQLYETISMVLLFLLLMAYYPFRRHDGEVMVLFMVGYAVHRFFNEMLRVDTDPVAFNMTLSQNVSVLVLIAAGVLALILWRKPVQYHPASTVSPSGDERARSTESARDLSGTAGTI